MEATKFFSSNLLLHHPSPLTPTQKLPKPLIVFATSSGRGSNSKKNRGNYRGRLVDENMIVLRMRIQEAKMLERMDEPPSDWMEWEKKYYAHYGYSEDVFEAIGLLQNCLMDMRPGFALGLIALVTLGLVLSTGVVLFHAIEITQIVISSLFRFN